MEKGRMMMLNRFPDPNCDKDDTPEISTEAWIRRRLRRPADLDRWREFLEAQKYAVAHDQVREEIKPSLVEKLQRDLVSSAGRIKLEKTRTGLFDIYPTWEMLFLGEMFCSGRSGEAKPMIWPYPQIWPCHLLPSVIAAIECPEKNNPVNIFRFFTEVNSILRHGLGRRPINLNQIRPNYLALAAARFDSISLDLYNLHFYENDPGARPRLPKVRTSHVSNLDVFIGLKICHAAYDAHREIDIEFRRLQIGGTCFHCGRLNVTGNEFCSDPCRHSLGKKLHRVRAIDRRRPRILA